MVRWAGDGASGKALGTVLATAWKSDMSTRLLADATRLRGSGNALLASMRVDCWWGPAKAMSTGCWTGSCDDPVRTAIWIVTASSELASLVPAAPKLGE